VSYREREGEGKGTLESERKGRREKKGKNRTIMNIIGSI